MTTKKRDVFAPDTIDALRDNWHLIGIGIIVLGGALFVGARKVESARLETKRREEVETCGA